HRPGPVPGRRKAADVGRGYVPDGLRPQPGQRARSIGGVARLRRRRGFVASGRAGVGGVAPTYVNARDAAGTPAFRSTPRCVTGHAAESASRVPPYFPAGSKPATA